MPKVVYTILAKLGGEKGLYKDFMEKSLELFDVKKPI